MSLKSPDSSGFHGIIKTAPKSACNTHQGLTRSTGTSREGLPVMVPKTCSNDDCDRKHMARGLCVRHYNSARLRGDFETTPRTPTRYVCSFEGCEKKHLANGLCAAHNSQRSVGTELRPAKTLGMPIEERFNLYVDKSGDCWNWTGGKLRAGYGSFFVSREDWCSRAHRFAFKVANGPIPDGAEVDHICRNRACVRPSHLRLTTRKQNMENVAARIDSQSGIRGVALRKKSGTYYAYVVHHGKQIYLGDYETTEEASAAATAKRLELFTHNELDRIKAEANA